MKEFFFIPVTAAKFQANEKEQFIVFGRKNICTNKRGHIMGKLQGVHVKRTVFPEDILKQIK